MAISVDWENKIINIPRADLLLVQSNPTEIRQLNLTSFKNTLKSLEASVIGMNYLDIHSHNPSVTVSGAVLARVIEIINGYTVTFEDGQYAVNLVGANTNLGDVVNVNQVSIRSSNSAGLQDLTSLQAASFAGGAVAIDVTSTYSGTTFPVGTRQYPVNNTIDAVSIAKSRGMKRLIVVGMLTLGSEDFSDGFIFEGNNAVTSIINITPEANISSCEFIRLAVTGTLDNDNICNECTIVTLNQINGVLFRCGLMGSVTLGGGKQALMLDCFSAIPSGFPVVDMGGAGQALMVRNYSGALKIINKTGPENVQVNIHSGGEIFLDSTVTDGLISIRGHAELIDNSTGTTTIDTDALLNTETISNRVWNENLSNFNISNSAGEIIKKISNISDIESGSWEISGTQMIFYKPDNITEIMRFDLFDKNNNPSGNEIFKRVKV